MRAYPQIREPQSCRATPTVQIAEFHALERELMDLLQRLETATPPPDPWAAVAWMG
jgi:hypothetical protein